MLTNSSSQTVLTQGGNPSLVVMAEKHTFKKSWVQIPTTDNRWALFHNNFLQEKICIVCLKTTKIIEKYGDYVPFKTTQIN